VSTPQYVQRGVLPPKLARPPAPRTVRYATNLMIVGAAATVADIISHYSLLSGHRDQLDGTALTTFDASTDPLATSRFAALAGLFIVGGLIQAALWLWLAFVCKRGHSWGRVVSTVCFALGCLLFGLGCVAVAVTTILTASGGSQFLDALPVLIGLVVTILLWSDQSGPHFQAVPPPLGAS
jgi:hypothetical protein